MVEKLGITFIVKPISQGCSKGVFLVKEEKHYPEAVEKASKFENNILLEEFVLGKEITVGILNRKILPIVDVVYSNQIFDYNTKFTPGLTSYQKSTLPIELRCLSL
ncbi:hypothetical protein CU633_15135 [Bacillus sp. V3-13]|uniref:hypothetical protein n=1 Tax=Bacillus sp. V3-13 TaxID=2053728 RepID=UPI000C7726B2|nr:hypothetical protein [Bacillus sp. V3-13]PLR76526.1 hypothetical protein CU633_15135 [Bacillus sp. V3-13]